MNFLYFLISPLLVIEVIVCVLLVIVILMQPSKAESGIGSAFGGQATDALFGANTSTLLAKVTAYLTAIFFALSFLLTILIASRAHAPSLGEKYLIPTSTAPAKPATPTAPAPVDTGLAKPTATETQKPTSTETSGSSAVVPPKPTLPESSKTETGKPASP